MSDIVDLGSFEFDMSAVEKQLVENKRQLEIYNTALNQNRAFLRQQQVEIRRLASEMVLGNAMQNELNEQYALGAISAEEFSEATEALTEDMEALQEQVDNVAEAQADLIRQNHELGESTRELAEENRSLNTLLQGGVTELQGNETAYKDLNKELNSLKLQAKNLGAEMVIMERNGEQNTEAYKALKEEWEKTSKEADELNDAFKRIDKAVGDNQRSVGDYKDQFAEAMGDIKGGFESAFSGDILGSMELFEGGFGKIKEAIGGVAKAIMANPLLAIGITLAYLGKQLWDFNANVAKMNKEVEQATGNMAPLNNELRLMGEAIHATFEDIEAMDAIQNLDMLIKTFGLSAKEAFELYRDGLVNGGAGNEEFRESINEYSIQFQKAGYSAKEFINIMNSGIDMKTFQDKVPDAIKNATTALTEQTKAARDALVNAFGATFTDDLLKRVRSGKTTVADALDEISEKAEKANLNQQQLGQITADVFGGAAEDIGGTTVVLQALSHAQDETNGKMSETQKITAELTDLNLTYEKSLDAAFNIGVVQEFQSGLSTFWVRAKTLAVANMGIVNILVTRYLNTTSALMIAVIATVTRLPEVFKRVTYAIGQDLAKVTALFGEMGGIIASAFSLDYDGVKKGVAQLTTDIKNFSSSTGAAIKQTANEFKASYSIAYDEILKKQKETTSLAEAEADAHKRGADARGKLGNNDNTGASKDAADAAAKAAEAARKKEEAEAAKAEKKRLADLEKDKKDKEAALKDASKRELDALKTDAEAKAEAAKNELADYIENNSRKYENDKALTKKKLDDQKAFLAEQLRLQKEAAQKELDAKVLALQQQAAAEGMTADQIKAINDSIFNLKEANRVNDLKLDALAKAAQEKLVKDRETAVQDIEKQARAVAFQQRIIDLETNHASEMEVKAVQLEADTQQELEQFRKTYELKSTADAENYDLDAEIKASRKELEAEIAAADDEAERARLELQLAQLNTIESKYAQYSKDLDKTVATAKVDAMASAFGSIKTLFGEATAVGKAAAIAETTINTYKSATAAYAAGASLGGPLGAVMGPILAGLAVASGLKSISKIVSTNPQYADGGYTGAGGKYEYAGDVHKGEIVWSQENIAAVGGVANAEAMRLTGGTSLLSKLTPSFEGVSGMLPNSNNAAINTSGITTTSVVVLDPSAVELIGDAVYQGSQAGIGDANINQAVADGANF